MSEVSHNRRDADSSVVSTTVVDYTEEQPGPDDCQLLYLDDDPQASMLTEGLTTSHSQDPALKAFHRREAKSGVHYDTKYKAWV